MIAARRKEREYFETSPEYGHLTSKMGAEYLAKLLSKVFISILSSYYVPYFITNVVPFGALSFDSRLKLISSSLYPFLVYFFLHVFSYQHLETVIRQRIPSIIALINKTIDELNAELDRIGRPIAVDSGVRNHNNENFRNFLVNETIQLSNINLLQLCFLSYRLSCTRFQNCVVHLTVYLRNTLMEGNYDFLSCFYLRTVFHIEKSTHSLLILFQFNIQIIF